ncbi:adenine phosphoribosyltransferase [Candidatus Schneideria nysicola]|uniref:adenine phosphoribosyltransferase n=1 Tax=Candidatus Schneideria nysicola TaxID=1081631 RepID=UPI001CAA6DA7|nr:adenine phosphoribosyltransferase [Candidatus Schneideria nysicola]UAJ64767.1 adenine phosphoribosyltransferase [Candidatus Schneideria nysicola]
MNNILDFINIIPNYPKPGISFHDITSLLENPLAYSKSISLLVNKFRHIRFTKVVGIESRGFLFGAPVALEMSVGFVAVRKSGKLPRDVIREKYVLEYGIDTLEIHRDAITPNDKVLIIDDLLATGGTACATVNLIRNLGGYVKNAAFIINLHNSGGKKRLNRIGVESFSLVNVFE